MDVLEQLTTLGFTEYEAKVYLALLQEHPATGYQIGKLAGVPRSMVYEALGRLEARGAVLKSFDEKATLYRPVSPDILLDRYEQRVRQRVADLRSSLAPLYRRHDEGRLWTFSGRREALHYAREMIERAHIELLLVLTDDDVAELREALTAAHARGVRLGVILTGNAPFDLGQVVRHPHLETTLHQMEETLMIVADDRECLIASGHATTSATVTTNPNLVSLAHQFVWMELFAQRIFARLGEDLLARLDPDDRRILQHEENA
ncbi:TrmB family transcriptional regulator [Roseiflexus sp.]|uniref:TrmB family transcriptional regulator n=1 Tax=Roseiflexus sp. TaxID=2562120 RepID=UPI0021DD9D57|nr:helix-turn-helix domain-containing protein [Roseiflexus sp.]GIV99031.1 MAG: hypothetical protein KatS3mg058_0435 [Roseiflexus sp.]